MQEELQKKSLSSLLRGQQPLTASPVSSPSPYPLLDNSPQQPENILNDPQPSIQSARKSMLNAFLGVDEKALDTVVESYAFPRHSKAPSMQWNNKEFSRGKRRYECRQNNSDGSFAKSFPTFRYIRIYSPYWRLDATRWFDVSDRVRRAKTLVHETAHKKWVLTTSETYGHDDCIALAGRNSKKARRNADSYAWFSVERKFFPSSASWRPAGSMQPPRWDNDDVGAMAGLANDF